MDFISYANSFHQTLMGLDIQTEDYKRFVSQSKKLLLTPISQIYLPYNVFKALQLYYIIEFVSDFWKKF